MMIQPSGEMLTALQAFANRNGRYWKDVLSTLWCNGRDYYEADGTILHSIRNELGPTWLYDTCKVRPVKAPKK